MNRRTIRSIDALRLAGVMPTAISNTLGVSVNTVKSHIRRHPVIPGTLNCLYCGKPVVQTEKRKAKRFCSDTCRIRYWNHQYRENIHE